jgi:hypothetical protein
MAGIDVPENDLTLDSERHRIVEQITVETDRVITF